MIYDDEPISITKMIIRWREKDLHTIWKGIRQIAQRPDVSTQKTDAVSTIDLIGIKGEEDRFIAVGNEICFYSSFAIECCGCQSDSGGNIDDSTGKSTKFLVTMNSFSSSHEDCSGYCIVVTCGTSAIDFVLGKIGERIKHLLLVNELRCSYSLWKTTTSLNWKLRILSETWSWQAVSFLAGSDSTCVNPLYNAQNKNGTSHFRIGTHWWNLPKIGEEISHQLNRNLAWRINVSEEIFEDYRRHLNENLRINLPNSPWFLSVVVD